MNEDHGDYNQDNTKDGSWNYPVGKMFTRISLMWMWRKQVGWWRLGQRLLGRQHLVWRRPSWRAGGLSGRQRAGQWRTDRWLFRMRRLDGRLFRCWRFGWGLQWSGRWRRRCGDLKFQTVSCFSAYNTLPKRSFVQLRENSVWQDSGAPVKLVKLPGSI